MDAVGAGASHQLCLCTSLPESSFWYDTLSSILAASALFHVVLLVLCVSVWLLVPSRQWDVSISTGFVPSKVSFTYQGCRIILVLFSPYCTLSSSVSACVLFVASRHSWHVTCYSAFFISQHLCFNFFWCCSACFAAASCVARETCIMQCHSFVTLHTCSAGCMQSTLLHCNINSDPWSCL